MAKERLQQVGFAGLIGAVAGATLTAHRGRAAVAVGAVAGAAVMGAAEAVARARQRPGEIPALWSRILASGALAAPLGWAADRLTGAGPVPVATAAGAAAGAIGLRPQKVLLGPAVGALVGLGLGRSGQRAGSVAAAAAVVGFRVSSAVLFRDPAVAHHYLHDSPYTYFTSDELHLGEISLECSRAGAAAAALWLTFQLLPPRPDGLGRVLAAGRRAALDWSELLAASGRLRLYQPPELDIVCYFPVTAPASLAAIDQASARMLADGMKDPAHPVYLSTLTVDAGAFARRHPGVAADVGRARILRSVLMKPESENYVAQLHARVEDLAG